MSLVWQYGVSNPIKSNQLQLRMQVANTLPSPYREILLFCICIGVLWGGLLVEQALSWVGDFPMGVVAMTSGVCSGAHC